MKLFACGPCARGAMYTLSILVSDSPDPTSKLAKIAIPLVAVFLLALTCPGNVAMGTSSSSKHSRLFNQSQTTGLASGQDLALLEPGNSLERELPGGQK